MAIQNKMLESNLEFEDLSSIDELEKVMNEYEFEMKTIKELQASFVPNAPIVSPQLSLSSILIKEEENIVESLLQTKEISSSASASASASKSCLEKKESKKKANGVSVISQHTNKNRRIQPSFLNQFLFLAQNSLKFPHWTVNHLLISREKLLLIAREKFIYKHPRDTFILDTWENIFSYSTPITFLEYLHSQLPPHSLLLKDKSQIEISTCTHQKGDDRSHISNSSFPKLDLRKLSINRKETEKDKKEKEKEQWVLQRKIMHSKDVFQLMEYSKPKDLLCVEKKTQQNLIQWIMQALIYGNKEQKQKEKKEHLLFYSILYRSFRNWKKNVFIFVFERSWIKTKL